MASLGNLLVTGAARFVNVIKGTVQKAQNGVFYGTCATAAATAAKVVTLVDGDNFELKPGVMIAVKFTVANTASNVTLNVNGTGAKSIWAYNRVETGATAAICGGWANYYFYYVYDGTNWVFLNSSNNVNNNSHTYTSAYCETGAATAAKAASCTNFSLKANSYLHFSIRYSNTAAGALTMNVNGTGAKPIYINGTASSSSNYTLPAGSYIAFYNGIYWDFNTNGSLPGTLSIANGGTNATDAEGARTNLGLGAAATHGVETTLANDSKLPTGAAVTAAINNAVDFGTVGSNQNPVYFNNGDPTPIAFTFGVDDDQNVQVAWDGDAPEIVIPTTSALAISSGGTGATTAAAARTNLGLGSAATYSVVSAVQDDENLVTNGAVYRYVNGKIEDELNGTVTSHDVSGSILSFEAVNAQPVKSLVLNLEPYQSGSGTPSPSNIRPISGYDSVTIVRCGKNLSSEIEYGGFNTNGTNSDTSTNRFRTKGFIKINPNKTYTASLSDITGVSSSGILLGINWYAEADYTIARLSYSGWTAGNKTVTANPPTGAKYARLMIGASSGLTLASQIQDLQLESGSTVTEYEAPQIATYPISLSSAGTVYGGTLDVTTGELVVDKFAVHLKNATWELNTAYSNTFNGSGSVFTGQKLESDVSNTNNIPHTSEYTPYTSITVGTSTSGVSLRKSATGCYVRDTRASSVSEFTALLASEDPTIVLYYATPITYHLTPTEVTTLLGENTIWMDAEGTLELTYEDVESSIKYADVGELGTAATHNASDVLVPDATLPTGVAVYNHTPSHAQNGIYYGTCATAAGTAAKVIELVDPTGFELNPGVMIAVKFTATNTASNVTFNVEGTGAKHIWYNASVLTGSSSSTLGYANRTYFYVYDGTYWVIINKGFIDDNTNTVPSAQCETAAATAAKVATCTNHTLTANTYCHFNIRYANTAKSALTMNVDSSGAKPIYINDVVSSSTNYTLPAGTYIAFYNGTNWYFRTDEKLPASISGTAANVRGCVLVGNGGTGATTASAARTNLGLAERSYSTETLATFYANVLADGYEIFVGTTDMTSKLTSSKASGVCFGFATHNAAQAFVEGLLYNASSGKIFTYRVASDGTVSLVKNVALTTA